MKKKALELQAHGMENLAAAKARFAEYRRSNLVENEISRAELKKDIVYWEGYLSALEALLGEV